MQRATMTTSARCITYQGAAARVCFEAGVEIATKQEHSSDQAPNRYSHLGPDREEAGFIRAHGLDLPGTDFNALAGQARQNTFHGA